MDEDEVEDEDEEEEEDEDEDKIGRAMTFYKSFWRFSVVFRPVSGQPTEQNKSCPNFFLTVFDPPSLYNR